MVLDRCSVCREPILVDELIVVQALGKAQSHLPCARHTTKCSVMHLGMIEVEHVEQVKEVFGITRFVSSAYRCDAQTRDGRFIRIEYIQ